MGKWIALALFSLIFAAGYLMVYFAPDMFYILPMNVPSYEDWVDYRAPSEKFIAMFPREPMHTVDQLKSGEVREYDLYVAQDDQGHAFMISAITYPQRREEIDSEPELVKIVKGMSGSRLSRKEKTIYQGREALAFTIETPVKAIEGIAFAYNNTLYMLTRASNFGGDDEDAFQFFIHSFQLIPQPGDDDQ